MMLNELITEIDGCNPATLLCRILNDVFVHIDRAGAPVYEMLEQVEPMFDDVRMLIHSAIEKMDDTPRRAEDR